MPDLYLADVERPSFSVRQVAAARDRAKEASLEARGLCKNKASWQAGVSQSAEAFRRSATLEARIFVV